MWIFVCSTELCNDTENNVGIQAHTRRCTESNANIGESVKYESYIYIIYIVLHFLFSFKLKSDVCMSFPIMFYLLS